MITALRAEGRRSDPAIRSRVFIAHSQRAHGRYRRRTLSEHVTGWLPPRASVPPTAESVSAAAGLDGARGFADSSPRYSGRLHGIRAKRDSLADRVVAGGGGRGGGARDSGD